jgi:hypothetical protein
MSKGLAFRSLGFAFIIFVFGSYVIVAQNVITGDWTANARSEKPDKIHLSFEIRTEKGGRNQHGTDFAYSDLRGLSASDTQNGKVSFGLAREAGTIDCEGSFTAGKGAGTFRFTPNYQFAEAMKSRGFDFAKSGKHVGDMDVEKRLFTATMLNITTCGLLIFRTSMSMIFSRHRSLRSRLSSCRR